MTVVELLAQERALVVNKGGAPSLKFTSERKKTNPGAQNVRIG